MTHAGRSVIVSGSTVAVGLLSMIVLPLPFIRSMGIGGMLIPAVSVLAAITLLPALLAVLGTRINSVRLMPKRFVDQRPPRGRRLGPLGALRAAAAVGRLRPSALAIVAVLVALGMQLNPNESQLKNFPGTGTAIAGPADARRRRHPPGRDEAVRDPRRARRQRAGGRGEGAHGARHRRRDRARPAGSAGRTRSSRRSRPSTAPRRESRAIINRVNDALRGTNATLGGVPAVDRDFVHAVYGNFPYVLAFVLVLTLILLTRAFRSIVLPIKAVILNLVSLGAAFGIVVFIFQKGHGSSLWNITATQAITAWIPLMIFAFLFGLSMDYEVFMLTRMREAYDETRLDRAGDRARPGAHREARHERRADPHVRVPRPLVEPGLRDQGVRDRPRGRDHLRRDRDPGAARARADAPARRARTGGCRTGRGAPCSSGRRSGCAEPALEG